MFGYHSQQVWVEGDGWNRRYTADDHEQQDCKKGASIMTREQKLARLAQLIHDQTLERLTAKYNYPGIEQDSQVTIKVGPVWTKVDLHTSGKYMVDAAGNIYGIKSYGVPHRGHQYGTLDTVDAWYWGEYVAVPMDSRIRVSVKAAGGRPARRGQ